MVRASRSGWSDTILSPTLRGDHGGEDVVMSLESAGPVGHGQGRPCTESTASDDGDDDDDDDDTLINGGKDRDFTDDPEERSTNPTLYLCKYWRAVSPQAPIYLTQRNPQNKTFSCKLTLHLPPDKPRTFDTETSRAFYSKRDAKRAVSEKAMASGVLEEARHSMAAMDRVGTSAAPTFYHPALPKRDARYNETPELTYAEGQNMKSAENPVSVLNLAIQKYCVESPAHALSYEYESVFSPSATYQLFLCRLTIRITPQLKEAYACSTPQVSSKAAKEAVTRIALQEGIVALLKMHNSMTTKVCQELGLNPPLRIEDHDPVDEKNTAGLLAQMVQEVTRNPQSMQCKYTQTAGADGDLHGAKLSVTLSADDVKSYSIKPFLRTKREAKEAVCRLAVKSGIRNILEARRNILAASRLAVSNLDLEGGVASSLPSNSSLGSVGRQETLHTIANPVGYLNTCIQACIGDSEALQYTYEDIPPKYSPGRSIGPHFRCKLVATLSPHDNLSYEVDYDFPTKKAAKEAIAREAITRGLPEMAKRMKSAGALAGSKDIGATATSRHIKATPKGFPILQDSPPLHAETDDSERESNTTSPYATAGNRKPFQVFLSPSDDSDISLVSPPPYTDASVPTFLSNNFSAIEPGNMNPLIASHLYRQQQGLTLGASCLQGQTSQPFGASLQSSTAVAIEQPLLQFLSSRVSSLLGVRKSAHFLLDIKQKPHADLYGGSLRILVDATTSYSYSVPYHYLSVGMAEEAAATKAIEGGVLAALSKHWPAGAADPDKDGIPEDSYAETSAVRMGVPAGGGALDTPKPVGDPFSQPVSYLHQACQVLIGSDDHQRPRYELTRRGDASSYGAILTVPTEPPYVYKVDVLYRSKAAAKEAVSRVCLDDNIIGKLKVHLVKTLAPSSKLLEALAKSAVTGDASTFSSNQTTEGPTGASPSSTISPAYNRDIQDKQKPDWAGMLRDYCRTSGRPEPEFITTSAEAAGENTLTQLTAKIGAEVYELDAQKISGQASEARLARMILKHLQKKDGTASAGT